MNDDVRPSADPDLAELQRLAREGRARLDGHPEAALDDLWQGIADEAFSDDDVAAPAPGAPHDDQPGVVPLRPRRVLPFAAAGAAAALVVGLAAGVVLERGFGQGPSTELAAVQLAPLVGDVEASGAVLRQVDGARVVEVALDGLPATSGYYEVWLLDESVTQLVSLGPVRPDGTYVVPDGVDIVDVPTVDVSREQHDGDPSHGGDSILRGTFTW